MVGSLAECRWIGRESEVLHGEAERVKHVRVDGVFIEINQIHLFTDLLHGGFRAERSNIRTDVTVCLRSDLEQGNIR
jgi:hypothetical protein